MSEYYPVPELTDEDRPFWKAAREHELRMQACLDCGHVRWPPSPICLECWSEEHEWRELSGRGTINSWVVFHREYFDTFPEEPPYTVVEVELQEGPRYLSNLVDGDDRELSQGMPVEVVFERVTDRITLPKFELWE